VRIIDLLRVARCGIIPISQQHAMGCGRPCIGEFYYAFCEALATPYSPGTATKSQSLAMGVICFKGGLMNDQAIIDIQSGIETIDAGFVYLMRPVGGKMIMKIGSTNNLFRRIATMRRKYDYALEYFFVSKPMTNREAVEHGLHLKYYRFHLASDWYALPEHIIDDIMEFLG